MAKASIIIVTYNGLHDCTIPCLQSIFTNTDEVDYEVIVVDNNSTDGTFEYLLDLAEHDPRVKPVLNLANRGFAGGNNDGIRAAKGEYLVMLNNDTLVTEDWLKHLVNTLKENPHVGLVGPVSNRTGNEQNIFTDGRTPQETIAQGLAWAAASNGDSFPCQKLCFFCIATRRDVMEKVGILDESFGLGFYEDDDYCLRVTRAGYQLVCREDVFVFHHGSASFDKNPAATRHLLKKNRKILEDKIGCPYRPRHPRDLHLDLVETYLANTYRAEDKGRMHYKIDNRLRLVELIAPRSIFKKLRFYHRIRKITKMRTSLPPMDEDL